MKFLMFFSLSLSKFTRSTLEPATAGLNSMLAFVSSFAPTVPTLQERLILIICVCSGFMISRWGFYVHILYFMVLCIVLLSSIWLYCSLSCRSICICVFIDSSINFLLLCPCSLELTHLSSYHICLLFPALVLSVATNVRSLITE